MESGRLNAKSPGRLNLLSSREINHPQQVVRRQRKATDQNLYQNDREQIQEEEKVKTLAQLANGSNSNKNRPRDSSGNDFKNRVRFAVESPDKKRQTVALDFQVTSQLELIDFEKISLEDFEFGEKLGSGSFGQVFKTKFKLNDQYYALKTLDKEFIIKNQKQKNLTREKKILMSIDHPNVIKLFQTFQDKKYVYFMYEYVKMGTLSKLAKKQKDYKFPIDLAKFYTAEIIDILEYLHREGIIHRDLKPQNILITQDYHLKLCDFGDALKLEKGSQYSIENKELSYLVPQQGTFCGTPLYVSPEMLEKSSSSAGSDLWALGVIIYQMISGDVPFRSYQECQTFKQIIDVDYKFPEDFDPMAKDLVTRLLVKHPQERLGAGVNGSNNDFKALKSHPFFKKIDWTNIHQMKPPIKHPSQRSKTAKSKHQASKSTIELPITEDILLQPKQEKEEQKKSQHISQSPQIQMRKEFSTGIVQQIKEIKRGLLKKKNRFFMQQIRMFVLTSEPRLKYYKNDNDFRGEIPLTSDVVAQVNKDNSFKLQTSRKVYTLKGIQLGEAEEWVKAINQAVTIYSMNLPK